MFFDVNDTLQNLMIDMAVFQKIEMFLKTNKRKFDGWIEYNLIFVNKVCLGERENCVAQFIIILFPRRLFLKY